MSAINSSWTFMVLRADDGSVNVLGVGDLGAGGIAQNPRKLTVSGPGIPRPPKKQMSEAEYQVWLTSLRAQNFQLSEGPMD